MSLNYTNLVSQGRAKVMGVPWSPEELEALLTLERECGIARVVAADYIRNGIVTVEDYMKAQEVKFTPKTLDEATADAEKALKEAGQKAIADVEPDIASEMDPVKEPDLEEMSEDTSEELEKEVKTSTGKKKTK